MINEEAVTQYFGQAGFAKFLELLRRKHLSSKAGARGYITLLGLTEDERRSLDGFFGTYSPLTQDKTMRISIRKFEKQLMKSRFSLTIPELLTIVTGQYVLTRQEQNQLVHAGWERMIGQAVQDIELTEVIDREVMVWISGLYDGTSQGSRTLRNVFVKAEAEAAICLKCCISALLKVHGRSNDKLIRLPILAAQLMGDAHALDWKYPLGRLFWWGLTAIHGHSTADVSIVEADVDLEQEAIVKPSSSQSLFIREGYRKGGVADDDVSSQVLVYAPNIFGEREERVLTLRQVERLSLNPFNGSELDYIYMVENPSVFAEIADTDIRKGRTSSDVCSPIIICGNGQPTTAVIKLLDWLLEDQANTGIVLRYGGDMDPVGLGIAQSLQNRYSRAFQAWHMNKHTYLRYAHQGIFLSAAEQERASKSWYSWCPDLAKCMVDHGVKLHQELWVNELCNELYSSM